MTAPDRSPRPGPSKTKPARPPLDGRRVMVRFAAVIARVPRYLRLGWLLVREPTVPARGKAALVGALGYAISPIDPLPGIIPVIGQLDDLAVLLLGVRGALNAAPADVAERHLQTSGLDRATIDADLKTIRVTAIWVAGRAVAGAGRLGRALGRWARSRVPSRQSGAPSPETPSPDASVPRPKPPGSSPTAR